MRALVEGLTREGMLCVQVALRAIPEDERCFEHYVEIIGRAPSEAAAEFERVMTASVARAMAL